MLKNCYKIKTTVYRNGSVSRDSVPLWKGPASEEPSGRSITQVNMETVYRNGSISRDSVPLWKDSVFSSPLNGREKCIIFYILITVL